MKYPEFDSPEELDIEYSWLGDEYIPQTSVRKINPDDKVAILATDFLRAAALDEYPLQTVEELNKYLSDKNNVCLVATAAKDGSNVVGYVIYTVNLKNLTLLRFAVHPEWERCGRGAALIKEVIAKSKAGAKPKPIHMELRPEWEAAYGLLFDLGFNFQMVGEKRKAIYSHKKSSS
jgi:ribosomal protein S18 acetylase RimI-like enzyme